MLRKQGSKSSLRRESSRISGLAPGPNYVGKEADFSPGIPMSGAQDKQIQPPEYSGTAVPVPPISSEGPTAVRNVRERRNRERRNKELDRQLPLYRTSTVEQRLYVLFGE